MSLSPPTPQPAPVRTGCVTAEEARYRAFVEQDAAGVAEVDAEGRFKLANRKFCEMTGYAEEELRQLRFEDITHPDDLAENLTRFRRLLAAGVPYGYEKRYVRKDGSDVWVHLSVTQIPAAPGRALSSLAVVVDLSDRRRAEQAARSNETNYKTLFNSIAAGFCVIEVLFDPEGRAVDHVFLETNANFERLTGLKNARGARMRQLVPAHEEHWFEILGRVATTGDSIRFEREARALHRWYSVYAFGIEGAGLHKVGILFDDISARKASEQRRQLLADLADKLAPLRDEHAITRTALDALGRFLDVDRCYFVECLEAEDRVIVGANYTREGTGSMQGGMTLFEFGGMEWWHQFAAGGFSVEDVAAHPLTAENAARYLSLGVRAYLVEPFKREGVWTHVLALTESRPRAWTADDRKLAEDFVARVWPLIERTRGEQELARAHRELEQRVTERTASLQEVISELEAYSYSISHDLRAPLRAMQTYASILTSDCGDQLDPTGREYLRRIMAAADRMDRLIRDVLVFSRVARDAMPMERIELGSFVGGIIDSYPGLSVATAQIEVVSPLGAVRANPAALTQCLANLLGNAIKFVPPGLQPRIRIWSEAAEGRRKIFVRDNGIGISREAHEKIFSMFYQIDQAREGTGVGLAVVRRAVERMQGTGGVSSAEGEGSTFWLELEDLSGRATL